MIIGRGTDADFDGQVPGLIEIGNVFAGAAGPVALSGRVGRFAAADAVHGKNQIRKRRPAAHPASVAAHEFPGGAPPSVHDPHASTPAMVARFRGAGSARRVPACGALAWFRRPRFRV